MTPLGTLAGIGEIGAGDLRLKEIAYEIDVWREADGGQRAEGILSAEPETLAAAFAAARPRLAMHFGTIGFAFVSYDDGSPTARIVFTDPVPGF